MAKLTFEDLSGSTPAMLWPEEFAKMADLVKNDQIVFVKGTLDRRRDPARADRQPDHPAGAGARRADPRRRRAAAQGVHQTEHLERLLRAVRVRPGQPRPLSRDRRPGTGPPRHLQGRRLPPRPLRRPALPDLENAVGPGLVRLLGHRGATARVDGGSARLRNLLPKPAPLRIHSPPPTTNSMAPSPTTSTTFDEESSCP